MAKIVAIANQKGGVGKMISLVKVTNSSDHQHCTLYITHSIK